MTNWPEGTLTTFATFQLELFEMLEAGAAAYAAGSIAAGLLFLRAGLSLGAAAGPPREPTPTGGGR